MLCLFLICFLRLSLRISCPLLHIVQVTNLCLLSFLFDMLVQFKNNVLKKKQSPNEKQSPLSTRRGNYWEKEELLIYLGPLQIFRFPLASSDSDFLRIGRDYTVTRQKLMRQNNLHFFERDLQSITVGSIVCPLLVVHITIMVDVWCVRPRGRKNVLFYFFMFSTDQSVLI